MENKDYQVWAEWYMEFANKLLEFKDNRDLLIEKIVGAYNHTGLDFPKMEINRIPVDVDPFSIFAMFNKKITHKNRLKIIEAYDKEFGVNKPIPETFEGIPIVNNLSATFYWFIGDRGKNDIQNLWDFFELALDYNNDPNKEKEEKFISLFDQLVTQMGIKWNLTMGLFWARPYYYLNLDSTNRWLLKLMYQDKQLSDNFNLSTNNLVSGKKYIEMVKEIKNYLLENEDGIYNYIELSIAAFEKGKIVDSKPEVTPEEDKNDEILVDHPTHKKYWVYPIGNNIDKWEDFVELKSMWLTWDGKIEEIFVHTIIEYPSPEAMRNARLEPDDNNEHAFRRFVKDVQIGDTVFVIQNNNKCLGKGNIISDSYIDSEYQEGQKSVRNVNWSEIGEWELPPLMPSNVLKDVTYNQEFVNDMNRIIKEESIGYVTEEVEIYNKENFLKDVYLNEHEYNRLVSLITNKKNLIIQGAPGVGKTYIAKRLAYSIMGIKDSNRVKMIQFHQSYSYEDFIMGFRPTNNGFELKTGAFYEFCKKASERPNIPYFFIIDEINRGNLSKIFGELFMLIENDKREVKLRLLYSDEEFSIPKNVHIIGMMNTADRSLAMLDYALRRRFVFYDLKPAFNSKGFRDYQVSLDNRKFNRLIDVVKTLNAVIEKDESLGEGFMIGHSYFVNNDSKEIDLDNIVEYELIPLLKEYWFDEPSTVKLWSENLRSSISDSNP